MIRSTLAGVSAGLRQLCRAPATWLLGIWLLLGALAWQPAVAQDTVSTDDIEFTPLETAPAAKAPDTAKAKAAAAPAVSPTTAASRPAAATTADAPASPTPKEAPTSLWVKFLTGFVGGITAVFMPCIFPLLPMTVSFFTKRSGSRARGIRNSLVYGLSIIVIYVGLGLIISLIFGSDALNRLATNGIFNFVFFVMLLVFGASFLGAFELTLPSSWVNKADTQADKGGLVGIFFMAATLALVSFSCTGPIVGTLLFAARSGQLLAPAVGMFGFSLALALPFTLFSLFPSWLSSLPKSGGWLNSVKVVLGFLELAFALKFLSNVDLAYHWEWFDREIFLALWIVIFAMLGFYLLGKLQFSHDSPVPHVSLPRLFLAIVVLSFTTYLVPGLWGAPLKAVSAFLPPQNSQDFDLYTPTLLGGAASSAPSSATPAVSSGPHKYANLFQAPLRLDAFFDYDEGMAYAKKVHKPVLIDFTGHACVNCRKMEANVWPDKQVLPLIRDKYVLIQLYVDDKTELPAAEQTVSSFNGEKITTLGGKYSDLQASRYNTNSQPYYVLLNPETEKVLVPPIGADYEVANFKSFLDKGLALY